MFVIAFFIFSCFQSFSENENECPACLPSNKKWLDIIKVQEQSRDLHETFHSLLERAEDPFLLVADYFGRDVFKKYMFITELPQAPTSQPMVSKIEQRYDQDVRDIMVKTQAMDGTKIFFQ